MSRQPPKFRLATIQKLQKKYAEKVRELAIQEAQHHLAASGGKGAHSAQYRDVKKRIQEVKDRLRNTRINLSRKSFSVKIKTKAITEMNIAIERLKAEETQSEQKLNELLAEMKTIEDKIVADHVKKQQS